MNIPTNTVTETLEAEINLLKKQLKKEQEMNKKLLEVLKSSDNKEQLQSNIDVYIELKNKIEQMKSGVKSGNVGTNEIGWVSMLMIIAEGDYHIQHKLDALYIIGKLGSQETISWLTNFFRREPEPTIKSAAARAIGEIGVDHEGTAIQTFLFLLINGGGIKDEQVLYAVASATGALCRFSGPPLSEIGIKILSLLSAKNQPPIVRKQAEREFLSIK